MKSTKYAGHESGGNETGGFRKFKRMTTGRRHRDMHAIHGFGGAGVMQQEDSGMHEHQKIQYGHLNRRTKSQNQEREVPQSEHESYEPAGAGGGGRYKITENTARTYGATTTVRLGPPLRETRRSHGIPTPAHRLPVPQFSQNRAQNSINEDQTTAETSMTSKTRKHFTTTARVTENMTNNSYDDDYNRCALFAVVASVPAFARDRRQTLQEMLNGAYGPGMYCCTQFVASAPFILVSALVYQSIFHWLVRRITWNVFNVSLFVVGVGVVLVVLTVFVDAFGGVDMVVKGSAHISLPQKRRNCCEESQTAKGQLLLRPKYARSSKVSLFTSRSF